MTFQGFGSAFKGQKELDKLDTGDTGFKKEEVD
jgi:hypothetical protein